MNNTSYRSNVSNGPRMTFFNHGSYFQFRVDQMTKHPSGKYGATMLKVHAELVLQADNNNVYIMNDDGDRLPRKELMQAAKYGLLPRNDVKKSA